MIKAARSTTTILLVDDIPSHLRLGTLLLSDAGFLVRGADSGEAALRSAKLYRPDAILSDVVMGDMDGFGLCRQVREDLGLCEIPVVLTSVAFQEMEDNELAASVGANALVHTTADFSAEIAALVKGIEAGAPRKLELGRSFELAYTRRVSRQITSLLARVTRSETRYRAVLDNAHDAVAVVDSDGYVLEANRAWEAIIKAPPETMRGKRLSEFVVPRVSLPAGAKPEDRRPLAVRASDGAITWVEFARDAVKLEGEAVLMTIGHDVSAQVMAAAAVKAGEAKYRALLERLPGVVWSTDSSGALTFATGNIAKVSGFTPEEVVAGGMSYWHSRVHPDDRLRVVEEYLALFAHPGETHTLAYRWQRKDGAWIWLQGGCSALVQPDGGVTVEGLLDDVTATRDLEERLRQAQKMEAVGQLTGGLAHDFNNLLTVILANAHFLGEDFAPGDTRCRMAEEIQDAAQRAAGLTRQLLSFSRKQTLQHQIFAPSEALQHFCKMLRRLIGEDIELRVELDPDVSRLEMDPSQLEQVVMNLVVNARDAMPEGGRLTVRLLDVELTSTEANGAPELPPGPYVMLAVSDTGSGIPPEVQGHIFEPFFTTKQPDRGTGLGLATVLGIVKLAGGAICVASEVGRGTTFRVYLPPVLVAAQASARVEAIAARLTGTETVLLIEDDASVARACRKLLEAAGYRVIGASSGETALEALLGAGPVDLVIADVVMPAGNGPQVVAALRAIRPELKVLYMTGYSEHSALAAQVFAAPGSLLSKPFTSTTLLTRVRSALGSRG